MSWKSRITPAEDGTMPEIRIGDDIVVRFAKLGDRAATVLVDAPQSVKIARIAASERRGVET